MYKYKRSESLVIKTRNNQGDLAKQICTLSHMDAKGIEWALTIKRYTLSSNIRFYNDVPYVKEYKGKRLYVHTFSIKLSSLQQIMDWIQSSHKITVFVPPTLN